MVSDGSPTNGYRRGDAPPKILPLPAVGRDVAGVFWRPSEAFVVELAAALAGKKVLEVFAGNGYLAGLLAQRGIDVVATSVLSSMDAHQRGLYHPVHDVNAVRAVIQLGVDCDVLLMCWPTVTNQALLAADLWSRDAGRQIVFIGEFTDYAKNHLGGCATDEFFERFRPTQDFASYRGNMLEKACMGTLEPEAPSCHDDTTAAPQDCWAG